MLRHRGPDEFGAYLDDRCVLGQSRLSIIDLSGGSQPLANEDNSIWITFNGEIFNYVELRPILEKAGHRFRTRLYMPTNNGVLNVSIVSTASLHLQSMTRVSNRFL